MRHRYLVVFFLPVALLLLFFSGKAAAQSHPGFGIETNIIAGRIFKHTKNFKGPIPALSAGADINFLWKTNGSAAWQQRRGYPTIGIGITYTYYDRAFYGQSIGFYPNLELPFVRRKNWEWTTRFGMGIGYISKHYAPYTPYWDTLNNAIGSHINNFSLFSSDLRYKASKNWEIQAGLSFTHMSSAKFRLPNLGINLLGAHIGVRYFSGSANPDKIRHDLPQLKNRLLIQARQGIAMSTFESAGSAATPVYLSTICVSRRYWGKNKILAGVDYSYYQGVYDFMRLQGIDPGEEKKRAWKGGIFAAHEFLYGRAGLYLQMGYYVHQSALPNAPIYQKLGMNWYIIQKERAVVKELYLSTLLKTHYATAELAELSLGISF